MHVEQSVHSACRSSQGKLLFVCPATVSMASRQSDHTCMQGTWVHFDLKLTLNESVPLSFTDPAPHRCFAFSCCVHFREQMLGRSRMHTEVVCCTQVNMAVASLIDSQMPIKRLLLLLDMARQDVPAGAPIPLSKWNQTIRDVAA